MYRKIIFIVIYFLFLLVPNYCFSYNFLFNSFSSFVIEDINFSGLNRISSNIILMQLPIVPGDILSEKKASNILKNLYSLNCFKKIKMEINGNKIFIKFLEKPIIKKIVIKGSKCPQEIVDIIKNNVISIGNFYNLKNLYITKEKLYKYYNEILFHFGVEINVYVSEHRSKIDIIFNINEGFKVVIKNIKIIENNFFSNNLLFKSFFNNKFFSFFYNNLYTDDKFNIMIEKLKLFYLNSGYADIEIYSNKFLLNYNKKYIFILLKVNKGKKYYLRNIYMSGKIIISKYKLLFFISKIIKSGDSFSINNVYKLAFFLKKEFQNFGYINTVIEYYCSFNKKKSYYDLIYYVSLKEKSLIKYIQFVGNFKIKDYILKKCLNFNENSFVLNYDMLFVKNNLLKTNLIEDFNTNLKNFSLNPQTVNIKYDVNEAKTTTFTVNLGYNNFNNFIVTAGAGISNFLSLGKTLNFNIEKGGSSNNYVFNYVDPYFIVNNRKFFNAISMGYSFKINNNIISKMKKNSDFSTNVSNCSLFFNCSYYKNYQINFELGYEHTLLNMDSYNMKIFNFVPLSFHKNIYIIGNCFNEYYFNLGLKYNSLDKVIFPNDGCLYNITFRSTIPHSNLSYYQFNFIYNYYKSLLNKYVFNIFFNLKYGGIYNFFDFYPFFKNYYLGGARGIRGFEEKSLGPKIDKGDKKIVLGGNFSFLFKFSFFISNTLKNVTNIRTGVFFDLGQVYDTISNRSYNMEHVINPLIIKGSVGIVFIWNSPLGLPLEISLAKPLNVESCDKLKNVNCTLGTKF
ncbi:MAG TPA: outer membrane protein assembly factor BamA [Candidatus Azosocius sp. HAIN]